MRGQWAEAKKLLLRYFHLPQGCQSRIGTINLSSLAQYLWPVPRPGRSAPIPSRCCGEVTELGGLRQPDTVTCVPTACLVLNHMMLSTIPDSLGVAGVGEGAETFEVAETIFALSAQMRRFGLGVVPWPRGAGVPPWAAARWLNKRLGQSGVVYRSWPIDQTAKPGRQSLRQVAGASRRGYGALLYSGADLCSGGIAGAVPRHGLAVLPWTAGPEVGDTAWVRLFEPDSGRVFEADLLSVKPSSVPASSAGGGADNQAGGTGSLSKFPPRPELGFWTRLVWVVAPLPK